MARTKRLIDAREYAFWQAEYSLVPWGDDWQQTCWLVSTIVNLVSKRKVNPDSIMPGNLARRRQSVLEMQQRLDTAFRAIQRKQQAVAKERQ